jgi:hypothetical protein
VPVIYRPLPSTEAKEALPGATTETIKAARAATSTNSLRERGAMMNPLDLDGAIAPHYQTEALAGVTRSRNEVNGKAIDPNVISITFETGGFQRIRSICAARSPSCWEEKVTNCLSPFFEQ